MQRAQKPIEHGPVLVTGGAGYIGSHVVLALLDAGYRAVVLDNLSTGVREAVDPRACFIEGDVCDLPGSSLMRDNGIRAVIHLAGLINADISVAKPLDYYWVNTSGVVALLRNCIETGVDTVIFSSSAAVYAAGSGAPVREEDLTEPATPYGASKLMSERILADTAHAHALRYCALRYFNVAGADPKGRSGQRGGARSLVKMALDAAMGRLARLYVYGSDYPTPDGSGVRDYIHVSDLAAAHVLVLEKLLAGAELPSVVNCGYGRGHSVFEVIDAVRRATGLTVPWELADRRRGDLASAVADNTKIRALGWRPLYDDLEQMIAHSFRWELSSGAAGAESTPRSFQRRAT